MIDKLVDISKADLPVLRDYFKIDWPKHNVGYGILDTYIRWLDQDPNISHLRICSLNGDWSDGTFIVVDWNVTLGNTLNKDFGRFIKALSLADFSKRPVVTYVESKLFHAVHQVVTHKGIEYSSVETILHRLPKEEASKLALEVPYGITIRPLTEADVNTANELWPHKYPGSLTFIKRLAKYNINFGAFKMDTELVAWCFRLPAGGLAGLQVVDSEKRKGLGTLIVKVMAKAISGTGNDVFAPIVSNNQPSLDMFRKIGFAAIDKMYRFTPKVYSDWEDI